MFSVCFIPIYFVNLLLFIALHKPVSFKKNVFDQQGIFELSWKGADSQKLSKENKLDFYTLFWCEKDLINPLQCNVCELTYYIMTYINLKS